MTPRRLGRDGPPVSPIGFGAFKIGRNEGIRYEHGYPLPSETEAVGIVRSALALGITLIDTAAAYGLSEERVGLAIADRIGRPDRPIVATKAGERFADGRSTYDFSAEGILASVEESRRRLGLACLDVVSLHARADDEAMLAEGSATAALRRLRDQGAITRMGFSGKSVAGGLRAIREGFDVVMVEYHPLDRSQRPVLEAAAERGVGILIKKALASGRLSAAEAIPFALAAPGVSSVVVGSLSRIHLAECVALAEASERPGA